MKKLYRKLEKCWLAANDEDRKIWLERMDLVWKQLTSKEKKELLSKAKKQLEDVFNKKFKLVYSKAFNIEELHKNEISDAALDEIIKMLEEEEDKS